MTINPTDQRVLRALTEAGRQHVELLELLDFYYDLYELQFRAKAQAPDPEIRDPLAMRWRLEGGIPQLTFDQLNLEPERFVRLVEEVTQVLLRHNPNWETPKQTWTLDAAVSQARHLFETWETLTTGPGNGGGPDVASAANGPPANLAVGFALAPYLQRAAEAILPHLDLALWQQGYCPVCGGRPNLALLMAESGARQLVCSRCNFQWGFRRVGCPFCRSREKQTYYAGSEGVYRLYVCPNCTRYLKTIDQRELRREVYPAVERLLTIGMDLAAHEEGFGS